MYNFIDINEVSEAVVLPSEALQINGEYIENLIPGYRTLTVSGREALSPELTAFETGIRDGSTLQNKRFPARTIKVAYQLITNSNEEFREAYNKLAAILNVDDAELIFNDEPDKFFTGTPSAIGEVEPGRNSVTGEFEIFCADPFKYSVNEYEVEPNATENCFLVDYNGAYKAYPTLVADFTDKKTATALATAQQNLADVTSKENATNEEIAAAYAAVAAAQAAAITAAITGNTDCGYVAFFNENEKIIQLGDPDEVDTETYSPQQTLVNQSFNSELGWNDSAKDLWAINSGLTSSDAVEHKGTLEAAVAAWDIPTIPTTTGTLLKNVKSTADTPTFVYNVTAKASSRTADSVKVKVTITAALGKSNNYFGGKRGLVASINLGDEWHEMTIKKESSARWAGNSTHTVSATFTVTGLEANTTKLTGIKFKVERSDDLGKAGILNEIKCSDLTISAYIEKTPADYYLSADDYGTGSNWHGPGITKILPVDAAGDTGAKNFTLTYCQKMAIGNGENSPAERGAFQVLLHGANNQVICGINVSKGSNGKNASLRFYGYNKVLKTVQIDLSFNNKYYGNYRAANKAKNVKEIKPVKSTTITKTGNTVTFNTGGYSYKYVNNAIKNLAVAKITFTFTKFGTYAPLHYNGLYWVKFKKNNCDTYKDIPNKFGDGDVIEADCRSGEILLNNLKAPELGALGNDWEDFYLSPGLNQIGFSHSDWVKEGYEPTFKMRYREVFI